MPRNYQRTTNRQSWTVENMAKAILEVASGKMGYKKAANQFGVPQSTLEDRLKIYRECGDIETASRKGLGRYKPIFTAEQENMIVTHVLNMESRLFGLTYKDLRRLAFQMAELNGITHNFNRTTEMAGDDWLYYFLKRHPNLSLRAPEPTSVARAMGFNAVSVGKFFDLLISILNQHKLGATKIYNVDETGVTTVPKKQSKIIAMQGRKQVGAISSAERGQLTTAVICFSASGHYVPPLLIFPRKRMKPELLDGSPPGTIAACHSSGWIQSEIFHEWLKHFIDSVKRTKDDPVLLLLDGHSTHTKNLPVIETARDNGVIILSFPPHCTHRLQPLDVSFMGPLGTYYSQEVEMWLRNNPGRIVTQFQISKLFGVAYAKSATLQNAMSGFQKTGIFPTNENIFSDVDFAASFTTDTDEIAEPSTSASTSTFDHHTSLLRPSASGESQISIFDRSIPNIQSRPASPRPSPTSMEAQVFQTIVSGEDLNVPANISTPEKPSCSTGPAVFISPENIIPIPHVARKPSNRRRKGKTAIVTSSPYKAELEDNIENQQNKKPKTKVNFNIPKNKNKKTTKNDTSSGSENDEGIDDNICTYCHESYGKSRLNEGWVQCTRCQQWAHEGCTGWSHDDLDEFLCYKC